MRTLLQCSIIIPYLNPFFFQILATSEFEFVTPYRYSIPGTRTVPGDAREIESGVKCFLCEHIQSNPL